MMFLGNRALFIPRRGCFTSHPPPKMFFRKTLSCAGESHAATIWRIAEPDAASASASASLGSMHAEAPLARVLDLAGHQSRVKRYASLFSMFYLRGSLHIRILAGTLRVSARIRGDLEWVSSAHDSVSFTAQSFENRVS